MYASDDDFGREHWDLVWADLHGRFPWNYEIVRLRRLNLRELCEFVKTLDEYDPAEDLSGFDEIPEWRRNEAIDVHDGQG